MRARDYARTPPPHIQTEGIKGKGGKEKRKGKEKERLIKFLK